MKHDDGNSRNTLAVELFALGEMVLKPLSVFFRSRAMLLVAAFLSATLTLAPALAQSAETAQSAPAEAVAPVAAATEARVPTPAVSAYRINPGDEIEIYVWGEERLQRVLRVLPDGTIAFPLVGQLLVEGQFPQNVEQMVSDRLRGQYRGEVPFVTVSVRTPAGMQFSVMGKVRSPGSYNAGRYINVLDALSLAGGPADFANLDNVTIMTHVDGRLTSTKVRLGTIFKAAANADDIARAGAIRIAPGDVVIVP
jgi:polysaccharide biosynthesis/export protein